MGYYVGESVPGKALRLFLEEAIVKSSGKNKSMTVAVSLAECAIHDGLVVQNKLSHDIMAGSIAMLYGASFKPRMVILGGYTDFMGERGREVFNAQDILVGYLRAGSISRAGQSLLNAYNPGYAAWTAMFPRIGVALPNGVVYYTEKEANSYCDAVVAVLDMPVDDMVELADDITAARVSGVTSATDEARLNINGVGTAFCLIISVLTSKDPSLLTIGGVSVLTTFILILMFNYHMTLYKLRARRVLLDALAGDIFSGSRMTPTQWLRYKVRGIVRRFKHD